MDYIPPRRGPRQQWLANLSDNVVAEVPKMGAPAVDGTTVKAAADAILAKMAATSAAEAALQGARAQEAATVAANLPLIRAKVRNWKTLDGYPASGSEGVLRLKATEPEFDPESYKPVIKVSIEGGKIRFDFNKLGVDALAFYCRLRGTVAWRKIGTDTEAPYFDTAPLAVPGVAEVREYMARGMVGDEEVGLDSDIVSIAFAG